MFRGSRHFREIPLIENLMIYKLECLHVKIAIQLNTRVNHTSLAHFLPYPDEVKSNCLLLNHKGLVKRRLQHLHHLLIFKIIDNMF